MNMTKILNPDEGGELTLWLNGGARPSAEPLYSAGSRKGELSYAL